MSIGNTFYREHILKRKHTQIAAADNEGITVQWAAVQGAESYSVEMRSDAGLSLSLSVSLCVRSVYESVCV